MAICVSRSTVQLRNAGLAAVYWTGTSPSLADALHAVVLGEAHVVRPLVRVEADPPGPVGQHGPRLGRRAGATVRVDGLFAARAPSGDRHIVCLRQAAARCALISARHVDGAAATPTWPRR